MCGVNKWQLTKYMDYIEQKNNGDMTEKSEEASVEEQMAIENASSFKHFLSRRKGLLVAVVVALAILLALPPGSVEFFGQTITLSSTGKSMIALLAFLITIFITEALPIGTTVMIVYGWLVIGRIVPAREAASLLSHDAVWFIMGVLMLAAVLVKYNIHKRILVQVLRVTGTKTTHVICGFIAFIALAAMFLSEHSLAALMLPVGIAIVQMNGGAKKVPNLAKLFMFSIAYGASIGGPGAPSGGARNIIMLGLLDRLFGIQVNFGAWMAMGLPIVLILIPCIAFILLKRFKPEVDDLGGPLLKIRQELEMTPMGKKEWLVILIFVGMLTAWIFAHDIGIGLIALLGILAYVVAGLIKWRDLENIHWGIVLLYFGAIAVGTGLQITGAGSWIAANFLSGASKILPLEGTLMVTAIGAVIMSVVTEVMSDGPAVATIGPILLEAARLSNIDPVIFGIAIAMASSFAYMFIIATPANAIVYSSGFLRPKDFLRAGAGIAIISITVLLLVIAFWWILVLGVGINGFH